MKSRVRRNFRKQRKTRKGGIFGVHAFKMQFENRNNCQKKFGMGKSECTNPITLKCYDFHSNGEVEPTSYYYNNRSECDRNRF
jgi:hypothetical protein